MRGKIATLLIGLLGFITNIEGNEIEGYDILVNPDSTCAGPYTKSTPYVGAQYPHPMFEVGFRYRIPYMAILPENGTNYHFDTEIQPMISTFIYWKWLKLGWNFALQPINKGFNFAYNINMGRLHFDINIAHIRNLRLVNESDFKGIDFTEDETRLRAFHSIDWGLNFEYTFNKNYALLSGYDYSYHRAQLKSQGTGIVAASYGYNGFNKRNTFGESAQADSVLATLPIEKAKMNTANVGAGYGHNFAFKGGRWVLGLVCVPYLSVGGAKYDYSDVDHHDLAYGVRAHARVNLTYNYRKGGVSLSGEYNGAYLRNNNFGYRRDVVNLRINHAFRLGEYGLKNCKTPGHQVMDWSQNILSGNK